MDKISQNPPSFNDLSYFVSICETGSLTRASERLGMTQPTLSQVVKKLEAHLGVELLIRDKKGVRPTKAGLALEQEAKILSAQWGQLKRKVSSQEQEVVGLLSLGAHDAVAAYTLPLFMKELNETYPALELDIRSGLSREICEAVISHKMDLGLVINPYQHPDLIIKQLFTDQVHFWRARKAGKTNLSTLICQPALGQTQGLLKKAQQELNFDQTLNLSQLENIARLTSAGCGVGIIPERVVRNLGSTIDLVKIRPELFMQDRLCLIYHMENRRLASLKATTELIQLKLQSRGSKT